jgi:hypothetical protein
LHVYLPNSEANSLAALFLLGERRRTWENEENGERENVSGFAYLIYVPPLFQQAKNQSLTPLLGSIQSSSTISFSISFAGIES